MQVRTSKNPVECVHVDNMYVQYCSPDQHEDDRRECGGPEVVAHKK